MRVLVACEESQEVCKAFRGVGHEAYSCDIQECSGGHPEWHIKGNVLNYLEPWDDSEMHHLSFKTMDGIYHDFTGQFLQDVWWDLIIAHPPCTFLTAASAVRLFTPDHKIKDVERYKKGLEAVKFFYQIMHTSCGALAIENPVPLKIWGLPEYSQIIEPFYFGDPWRKRTALWLKNLPRLESTDNVEPLGLWVGSTSKRRDPTITERYVLPSNRDPKRRSKTFPGIAKAMAEQWGCLCNA